MQLVPVLIWLVNTTVSEGCVDSCLKVAHVRPLLKRSDANVKHPEKLRPSQQLALHFEITRESSFCQAVRTHGQVCSP